MERTIHMSGRAPIVIEDGEWPEVGHAWWCNGPSKEQSTERAWVRVRRHSDGRQLVYGLRMTPEIEHKVGYLLNPGTPPKEAHAVMESVCVIVGVHEQELFDSLPPESV